MGLDLSSQIAAAEKSGAGWLVVAAENEITMKNLKNGNERLLPGDGWDQAARFINE